MRYVNCFHGVQRFRQWPSDFSAAMSDSALYNVRAYIQREETRCSSQRTGAELDPLRTAVPFSGQTT